MAINPFGTAAHVADGRLVFTAIGFTPDRGFELWGTDGTPAGTRMVRDINPGLNRSFPYLLFSLSTGQVVFRADNGTNGFELWTTDGTTAGTTLLRDIAPGLAAGDP